MKVLWLGAGASISAGYPSASSLLSTLDLFVKDGPDVMTRNAWRRFCEFRDSATGVERTLLYSPNPEVVLTLPDLLTAALDADNEDIESGTSQLWRESKERDLSNEEVADAARRSEMRYHAQERERLDEARAARRDFLTVLDNYLFVRHHSDGESRPLRDYLRRELSWLDDGDIVITTNWDTSIERTLLEDRRWTPADGYGFNVDLIEGVRAEYMDERNPLPAWVPAASAVRVLKLHGSFGWRTSDYYGPRVACQGEVWLDYSQFLHEMPFQNGSEMAFARDTRTPAFYDPAAKPSYIIPSFLKQLTGSTMQHIWHEAARALADAINLRVIGASLPESDVAVRTLLNAVRYRASAASMEVVVHNPSRDARERWRRFLGDSISTTPRKAGEAVNSGAIGVGTKAADTAISSGRRRVTVTER
jgi:hypothetical protein